MSASPIPGVIGPARLWSDTVALTKRNLLKYRRVPTLLLFSTIQPIMFTLLFIYVFGGAIQVPGLDYKTFLMPGIFVQTALFGSTMTGVGLAEDMQKGIIDRFRSLPMARSAVLLGRTSADAVRNLFVVLLITMVGMLIGFRFQAGLPKALGAILLAVLFGYAFSWISATIGVTAGDVETAQAAGFIWVFPLVFASSAFVPLDTLPGWLQVFAEVNPVTVTVDALRGLVLGTPLNPALWQALAWITAILLVFVPLGVRQYRRAV